MLKYELIPAQLIHEGTITADNLFAPQSCVNEIVLLTHDMAYVDKLKNLRLTEREQRHIGFPQSHTLINREFVIAQGTIDCSHFALTNGIALNVAGGTHHAFRDRGEGFCMLNDIAIAASYLLEKGLAKQILVIDLDVHQGNGTAKIFENESHVFTFSMHGEHNYPFHKEKSDLDIPLMENTEDYTYLKLLKTTLPELINSVKPDFAFFLSGVDILKTDRYGKLKITPEGCRQRDQYVFEILKQHQIPCTVSMGGGYSADIKIIVEAHCNTFRSAKDVFNL